MDTYILNPTPTLRIRRRHSTEFKQELIGLCQPGVSISAVALAHGVNANLLRRWIKAFAVETAPSVERLTSKLVPVKVESSQPAPSCSDIQFEIHRGATRIHIKWPMAEAQACAQWLGDWIK